MSAAVLKHKELTTCTTMTKTIRKDLLGQEYNLLVWCEKRCAVGEQFISAGWSTAASALP